MDATQSQREPQGLRDLRAELQANPALADAVLGRPDVFPPAPVEPERVIRCSPGSVEPAICRALARAVVWGELWGIEIVESQR